MDNSRGYQQSHAKSEEKEKKNRPRDLAHLNLVMAEYIQEEIYNKRMQVAGIDTLAVPKDMKIYNPDLNLHIDIKTSDKIARKIFVFELYMQGVEYDYRIKSWSYRIDARADLRDSFYIAFTDEEKLTIIQSIKMVKVMELIEKEYPSMIKKKFEKATEEDKKKGKTDMWKWIVELDQSSKLFKMMQPAFFQIKNGKVVNAVRYDTPKSDIKVFPRERSRNVGRKLGREIQRSAGRKIQKSTS